MFLYNSIQYDSPTNNNQDANSNTNNNGIDSISSEDSPGNSQGGAAGGVPNDNSTPSPEPDDGSLKPNDWYSYANEGNQDLIFGTPGARGSVNSLQINYAGLAFKCTDANGGFNIQNPSGDALINVFMQDLPDTVSDTDPAKFRSILVCKDDELKEIYVLSTKPEDPA